MIRLIMTIFLLLASVMPVWANDKEDTLPPEIKTLMEAGIELYEEEVLSNLRLEVKDRLEGDTYHISYTLTNPTNTQLKKKVAIAAVTYDLCHSNDPYQSITQCTDAISELAIEPYATTTINFTLKQPMPVQFNHLTSGAFYFEDNSALHYTTLSETAPASAFHLTPITTPFGDVSLNIHNYSPTETITELRDIRLHFMIGEESRKMLMAEPIAVQIKPGESYSIPLFTLSSANSEKSASPFTISAKTANTTRNASYRVNIKINGIPHTYIDNYDDATQVSGSLKSTKIDTLGTYYQFASKKLDPNNGAFYLDGSALYGYIKVSNNSNAAITASQAAYKLTLPYFDRNAHYQEAQFTVRLPQNLSLAAGKTIHCTFKLPLPADFAKIQAANGITVQSVTNRSLASALLAQVDNASDIPKKGCTLLTDITAEK